MATLSDILSGKVRTVERSSKVSIDYPQAGEKVHRGHYSIRISAQGASCQVMIDSGSWQDCRVADGFSWYDWTPEQTGAHRISARARSGNKWAKTERTCTVE